MYYDPTTSAEEVQQEVIDPPSIAQWQCVLFNAYDWMAERQDLDSSIYDDSLDPNFHDDIELIVLEVKTAFDYTIPSFLLSPQGKLYHFVAEGL